MKLLALSAASLVALTSALPTSAEEGSWQAPADDAFRGPCPMLNTLANHGYLPRDGKNFTEDRVVHGLNAGLNFDPALGKIMFQQALPANPEPNATFFTLDQLNVHNVLEHDASLSRSDAYFGNNHVFNYSVFAESTKYWTGPIIDRNMMANSKIARQLQSKASNPTYRFTNSTENFSIGEILAPFVAFGDRQAVTVEKRLVEYFFQNERLPTKLGWKRTNETVTLQGDILRLSAIFSKAASLITEEDSGEGGTHGELKKRVPDLHAGIF